MNLDNFNQLINTSTKILIVQADNPDGDSLASSLALESFFANLGKEPIMFCAVDIPTYLRHISGWDRVVHELPHGFDLCILVDTGALSLLETLQKTGDIKWLKTKPLIILDHHNTKSDIDFANEIINQPLSSTGELIHKIATKNNWEIDSSVANYLAVSIIFDTLGLSSESVTANTLTAMADLVKNGANLSEIDNNRRQSNKKTIELVRYKADLLKRVDVSADKRVATVDIPWSEIQKYSHDYNPSMLVLDEMRMITDVYVAIAFKTYPDGKVTAKIRTNYGCKIAGELAEAFGGGGHVYASGFKQQKVNNFNQLKLECIKKATELLDNHETL